MFIDETWASTNMAPTYGRGPRGERVEGVAPHGHWKTATFLAALRHDGLTAPCVFDGAINGARFRAPPRSPDRGPFGIGSAGLLPADGSSRPSRRRSPPAT